MFMLKKTLRMFSLKLERQEGEAAIKETWVCLFAVVNFPSDLGQFTQPFCVYFFSSVNCATSNSLPHRKCWQYIEHEDVLYV